MPARTASPGPAAWAARLLRVRRIVRAPILLYRARLGFVFGSRLLMLEHTGRKTGIRRYVILEAVGHPDPAAYIVAAGFGSRAQWLQNVRACPRVRVYAGGRRPVPATARPLDSQETAAALTDYAPAPARMGRAPAGVRVNAGHPDRPRRDQHAHDRARAGRPAARRRRLATPHACQSGSRAVTVPSGPAMSATARCLLAC